MMFRLHLRLLFLLSITIFPLLQLGGCVGTLPKHEQLMMQGKPAEALNSLEDEVTRLTAQYGENDNRLRQPLVRLAM